MAIWERQSGTLIEVREDKAQEAFAVSQGWIKQKPKRTRRTRAEMEDANERDSQHRNS